MICFFLIGRFLELFLAAFFIAWIPVGLLDHVKAKRSLVDDDWSRSSRRIICLPL